MIGLILLIFACSTGVDEEMRAEWIAGLDCDDGDIPVCYGLRKSKKYGTASHGLSVACRENYKDSCRLLFDHFEANYGKSALASSPMETLRAFRVARTSCVEHRDLYLCKAALNFGEKHPDYADFVEPRRARLQAVLDGKPVPPYPKRPTTPDPGEKAFKLDYERRRARLEALLEGKTNPPNPKRSTSTPPAESE